MLNQYEIRAIKKRRLVRIQISEKKELYKNYIKLYKTVKPRIQASKLAFSSLQHSTFQSLVNG